MPESQGRIVYVVDDDRDVRLALTLQLRTLGYEVYPFIGAVDFLEDLETLAPGCILLDVRIGASAGLQAVAELHARSIEWPLVAMSDHAELSLAVHVMKCGAIDFLEKPIEQDVLRTVLRDGFEKLDEDQARRRSRDDAKQRIALLSPREQDVLRQMLDGASNKQIAHGLALSVRTVEMHRANVLAKLGVRNVAQAAILAYKQLS